MDTIMKKKENPNRKEVQADRGKYGRAILLISSTLLLLGVIACQDNSSITQYESPNGPNDNRFQLADVIQLIHPGDDRESLANNTDQEVYRVNKDRRLLIRFNTFDPSRFKSSSKIVLTIIGHGNLSALKLCLIKKEWVLGSTWNYPIPGFNDEKWDGGDLSQLSCIFPDNTTKITDDLHKNIYLVGDFLRQHARNLNPYYGWIAVGTHVQEDLLIKGDS